MDEVRARGLDFFDHAMGAAAGAEMRRAVGEDGFGGAMASLAVDFAFGSVWSRDGLERKQRSLVVLGIVIAQRQTLELKNHLRIALANGLTQREIEEVVLQSVPYVGFPAAAAASTAMIEVFREKGLDAESKTSVERGLR